jgi:hypothetical protein
MRNILAAAITSFILIQQSTAQISIVHFKKDGRKQYAYYSHEGQWRGTESRVRRTRHLPIAVQTAWKNSGYIDWYVHNIRKIETPEQQLYVLHLNNGGLADATRHDAFREDHVLYFTRDGALVNAEKI